MSVTSAARRLLERRSTSPVLSVYIDLDPEEFATPAARTTQIDSLLDEAHKRIEADGPSGHEELMAVRADLERVRAYLRSDEPPYEGARALAVFCSVPDDLFEVLQLAEPVHGQVVIEDSPFVEPLIRATRARLWCVALVTRRDAWILAGPADRLRELRTVTDDVHGQHQQGGWSQARYERSYEQEADEHLRHVAELLYRRWRYQRYDRLVLGGPHEDVTRLEGFLHNDIRPTLVGHELSIDLSAAGQADVQEAVAALVEEDERARERAALDGLAEGIGAAGRAAGGAEDVVAALNERRVQTLLLDEQFDHTGSRCPTCGLLSLQTSGPCPTGDGGELEPQGQLREAAIRLAALQDADVIVVTQYPDLGTFRGIGALLRF